MVDEGLIQVLGIFGFLNGLFFGPALGIVYMVCSLLRGFVCDFVECPELPAP